MIQRDVSIGALRRESREIISTLLNPEKVILSDQKKQRYWPGLAELCGIGGQEHPNIQRSRDPCARVLELWRERDKDGSTIEKLLSFLEVLDRFDVIDDITPLLENDIEFFKKNPNGFTIDEPHIDDKGLITRDDVIRKGQGLPPQIYDAFVLFADDDIEFGTQLIKIMEEEYKLKLCARDRDLLGGLIEYDSIIQLISKRCKRLILIISPSFFDSPANKFFCTFAQVEGIDQRKRKIIPLIYKHCENLPPDLRMYFILHYERMVRFGDFWSRLYNSITATTQVSLGENAVLKKSVETLVPKQQVKFASMINLTISDARNTNLSVEEKVSPSPSVNSLEPYLGGLKKKDSFYKRMLKKINPKNTRDKDEAEQDKSTKTNEDVNKVNSPKANGVLESQNPLKVNVEKKKRNFLALKYRAK